MAVIVLTYVARSNPAYHTPFRNRVGRGAAPRYCRLCSNSPARRTHAIARTLAERVNTALLDFIRGKEAMTEKKQMMVYAAAYETVEAAMADLDAIQQMHKDEVIGQYDAAVIDQENGKPHVVKRMDRPYVRVIPEWFGGGTLPRKELHEAAEELTANQAGLIAVGEPTIEKGLDKAFTGAAKVVKRTVDATTDEITSELQEALKG